MRSGDTEWKSAEQQGTETKWKGDEEQGRVATERRGMARTAQSGKDERWKSNELPGKATEKRRIATNSDEKRRNGYEVMSIATEML